MALFAKTPHTQTRRALRGLTLIELLMALTVLAIVTGMAMPAFASLVRGNRLASSFNLLLSTLQLARSQAIQSRTMVVVCPGDPAHGCTGNSDWHDGWIVVLRPNASGQPDARSRIVAVQQPLPDGIRIQSSRSRQRVQYRPDGSARGSNLSLRLCLPGQSIAERALVVNNGGRARKVSGKALASLPKCLP